MIEKKTHKSKKDIEHKQKKKSKSTHSRPDEVDQMESRTKEENPAAQEDSIPPKTDKRQKKRKLESSVQEQQHKTKGEKRSKQVEKLLNKMDNETQPEQSSTASPTKIKTKSSKKHKKTKKELPSDGDDVDSDKESVDSMCLTYLRMWKQNRDQWAFKKVRQVWLLQNMYSCDRVPDEDFEVLLEYMADLKGRARQLTVEKAEKLLSAEETDDKEGEKLAEAQYERVRQILQLLT